MANSHDGHLFPLVIWVSEIKGKVMQLLSWWCQSRIATSNYFLYPLPFCINGFLDLIIDKVGKWSDMWKLPIKLNIPPKFYSLVRGLCYACATIVTQVSISRLIVEAFAAASWRQKLVRWSPPHIATFRIQMMFGLGNKTGTVPWPDPHNQIRCS